MTFGAAALLPLLAFGLAARGEVTTRYTEQVRARIDGLTTVVSGTLAADEREIRTRLAALAKDLAADSRLRVVASDGEADRRWLLDWAGPAMRLAGLDFLEVLDRGDRIVSSGHFRNDFDRDEGALAKAIRTGPTARALGVVRLAEGTLSAIVAADSVVVGGRRFTLLGGRSFDSVRVAALAPGGELAVVLVTVGQASPEAVDLATMPLIDLVNGAGRGPTVARIVAVADPRVAGALVARLDRWLVIALGLVATLAGVAAWWLGGLVSRPVVELAERTERIDLDRLDTDFPTDRKDEIGTLARGLDQMTRRLRASATRLRDSERRATIGDLARQVNHDIKNGLAPIRHVIRHLAQTANRDPGALPATFTDRQPTLESSIDYLDQLARNYAKLTPALALVPSNLNEIIGPVATSFSSGPGVSIVTRLAPSLPMVRADAVVVRRVLENLLSNAVESLGGAPGVITVVTSGTGEGRERRVQLSVADNGGGIPRDQLDRIFDDFYTTKPDGTGLGLSVVRRLVTDLGGNLRVESELGRGTVFVVEIPAG